MNANMPDTEPKPGASDTAARYWDSISNTIADGPINTVWRRHSDTVNERLLREWLQNGRYSFLLKTDLFDESIGVGLCLFLSDHSHEVHGIDISEFCVKAASERYPSVQTSVADIRKLPYASGYFDCIVSNSTLDHFPALEDIETSLEELRRVLRPGGELIITLDNLQNPVIWLRSILPFHWLHRIGLLPYYVGATTTKTGLKKMLTQNGFQVTAMTAILHCPRAAAIPLSNWTQRHCAELGLRRWLRTLMAFEWLGRTPLRYFTGHFIAVRAIKP